MPSVFHADWWRRSAVHNIHNPSFFLFKFAINFIRLRIDHHPIAPTFHIFLQSAKWNWKTKKKTTKTNKLKKQNKKVDLTTMKTYSCKVVEQCHLPCFRLTSKAFVSIYLWESPRDRDQNRISSFFSENGFRLAKEIPGMPSSIRITVSFTTLLKVLLWSNFYLLIF